jgi:hypothetical protein
MTTPDVTFDPKRPNRVLSEHIGAPYQACAIVYNAILTGILLSVAMRRGAEAAGEVMFKAYRAHHLDKFLSSFDKLGLTDKPHAVACAQYHYLANSVGGVRVEFMPESDTKAWVRFPHPRWVYQGPAICGIPLDVSRAMLRGWFAHNGVSLNNPRLGFVCTGEDVDGQSGLAGYFREFDAPLSSDERLQFSPGERPPPFDPALAPMLDTTIWPSERLEKANRNYAMAPVRQLLPKMADVFGQDDAAYLGRSAAKLIGLQYYETVASLLGIGGTSLEDFGAFFVGFAAGQGDEATFHVENNTLHIEQTGWRLARGLDAVPESVFETWNGFWEGALLSHNHDFGLQVMARQDWGDDVHRWLVRPRS